KAQPRTGAHSTGNETGSSCPSACGCACSCALSVPEGCRKTDTHLRGRIGKRIGRNSQPRFDPGHCAHRRSTTDFHRSSIELDPLRNVAPDAGDLCRLNLRAAKIEGKTAHE